MSDEQTIPKLGRTPQPHAGAPVPYEPSGTVPPPPQPAVADQLVGRRVVLCVTGSIAAYKAVHLTRLLVQAGTLVDVVLTESAEQFVGAATFSGITGRPTFKSMFAPGQAGELHVELARDADMVVVAPATADILARGASGRASDLTSALLLCARCPVLVAPAMHPHMWEHPATQRNVDQLVRDGRVRVIGPEHGVVASGDEGTGRLAEPEAIFSAIASELAMGTLRNRHVVVTAGPTVEDLDPVRFISNRSSGKMGFALAQRAAARGARVTLVCGPVSLPTPYGVERIDVRSALEMRLTLWHVLGDDLSGADALIMAAAVADYRPTHPAEHKLKRSGDSVGLDLTPNPDLIAEIGRARASRVPVLVAFALETVPTEQLIMVARSKLVSKRVDMVVANRADSALDRDTNRATLVGVKDAQEFGELGKAELAEKILDWLSRRLEEVETPEQTA